MIKKEKIFELKIQEDDEISGIDSISLVDEPAIEVNWVAFKKEVQEDFHIPDGEDETYLGKLLSKGQPEQELLDEGWEIDRIESVKQNFSTSPNDDSYQDNSFYRVRYKYSLNGNIKQSPIIPTTRQFCRELIQKNYVWRIEEVENEINSFGQSAQFWRGGYNCRHEWFRIFYKKSGDITNKSSVNKNKITGAGFPIELSPEWLQPNTVTDKTMENPKPSTVKNLGLSKEKFVENCPTATQDVKTNLKNRQECIDVAHYGPLNPNEPNEDYWKKKANMFGGDVQSAKKALCGNCSFFIQTKSMLDCIANGINDVNEWDTIEAGDLGYCEAFDFKCASSRTCDAWVVGGPIVEEKLDITPNPCWDGYEPIGLNDDGSPRCVPIKENMESVADYPDSVKNNAKAVLKYVEENGWGSCGTEVGKIRANQLAKGEPISIDTVKRMYSYLSRHKVDLKSSKGYGDGCGKLMYDSWGGLSALSWAENKLKNFVGEKVSIDYDDTLSTDRGKELAKKLLSEGVNLYIVTRRQESDLGPVYKVGQELGILKDKVHGTNGKLKWETIKKLGITKHIDNNPDELKAIKENLPDVQTEKFGYDIATLPVYVDELPKKKKKDMSKQYFATDSEKHIVLGPAMVPDQKIFRKDNEGNPYYVYFSSPTIAMIAQKYMKNKYTDNNDMMHDGKAVDDVHVLESWIKESNNDKSSDYGFENLPVGTWFVSMKINNPDIWDKVKDGTLNGFSVSGFFEEVAQFTKEEMFLYQVAEILKKY